MANFNTYQTRQLYVAKAVDSSLNDVGDIYLKTTANGKAFFSYRNADGLLLASDVFDPKNIVSLKKTSAADMNIPLMKHTIAVDSSAVTLSNLVGKVITLTVNVHQVNSYDESDSFGVVASVVGTSTNTDSNAALYKALAKALINAVPALPEAPFKVYIGSTEITKSLADGSYPGSGDFMIVENPQKYIRGKMAKEAYSLSVAFNVGGLASEDIIWGTDTVAQSTVSGLESIPSVYAIADLEAFALGERANYFRYGLEPNYVAPTYMVDLSKSYDIVSIEYFWQGGAENVQKSPRMIQVACEVSGSGSGATSAASTIYSAVQSAMEGSAGSGSGA